MGSRWGLFGIRTESGQDWARMGVGGIVTGLKWDWGEGRNETGVGMGLQITTESVVGGNRGPEGYHDWPEYSVLCNALVP